MSVRASIPQPAAGASAEPSITSHSIELMDDASEWDEFVVRSDTATFAHLATWRAIISDVCGHESCYCVARDASGGLAGVLPLVLLRSRLLGRHLISLPFLNYGGPAGDRAARSALVRHAEQLATARRVDSLVLRTRHAVAGAAVSTRKVTVLLPLAPTVDDMWVRRFGSKLRTKIKRPMRDAMETRFGAEQLDAFYEVWSHNMRDLGTPALPRSFFRRIVEGFPELVLIGATRFRGRPVAAGFGFVWGDEFEMTWSSGLSEFGAAKPNMLLYWDFMRTLIDRGVAVFNFGRSTPGTGPHDFKRAWGGDDVPLPWIEWPARAATETRDSGVARAAAATWRRLPLAIANRVGPMVSPGLPWW